MTEKAIAEGKQQREVAGLDGVTWDGARALDPVPQNVPGTWEERPKWKCQARYSLEQVHEFGVLRETLAAIDKARKQESENDS